MSMVKIGVVVGLLFALGTGGVSTARTANLTMATPAKVGVYSSTISASVLAPSFCANRGSLGATAVVVGANTGNVTGGASNELVLGHPYSVGYTINGGNGNDCVVGAKGTAGTETIRGGGGTGDYCIGNGNGSGGTQTFNADCDGNTQN